MNTLLCLPHLMVSSFWTLECLLCMVEIQLIVEESCVGL